MLVLVNSSLLGSRNRLHPSNAMVSRDLVDETANKRSKTLNIVQATDKNIITKQQNVQQQFSRNKLNYNTHIFNSSA